MSYMVELTGTTWYDGTSDIPQEISRETFLAVVEMLGLKGARVRSMYITPTSVEVERAARTPNGVPMVHNASVLYEKHSIPIAPRA
jgi:hypothetical protein